MQQILCAIDGSPDSTQAAATFALLMGPGERLFTILCVIEPSSRYSSETVAVAYYQRACNHAEALVAEAVVQLLAADIAAQSLVLFGDPSDVIKAPARASSTDVLIVESTYGDRRHPAGDPYVETPRDVHRSRPASP